MALEEVGGRWRTEGLGADIAIAAGRGAVASSRAVISGCD
jgi:hypothetical protein